MKLSSMKLSSSESKGESAEVSEGEGPTYPWGMCIYLDATALEKLGMKREDFEVGASMDMAGKVRVVGTSEREREGGEKYTSVDLQITDFGVGAEMAKTSGGKLYGKDDE